MYKFGTSNLNINGIIQYEKSKRPMRRRGINGILAMEEYKRYTTRMKKSDSRTENQYTDSDDSNDGLHETFENNFDSSVSTKYQMFNKINELNQQQYNLEQNNEIMRQELTALVEDVSTQNQTCSKKRPEETTELMLSKQQYIKNNDEQINAIPEHIESINKTIDGRNAVLKENIKDINTQIKTIENQIRITESEIFKLNNPIRRTISWIFKSKAKNEETKQRVAKLTQQLNEDREILTGLKVQRKDYENELQYTSSNTYL